MEEHTFYDIHMHAFNLSHPDLRAFIRRFAADIIKVQLLTTVVGIMPFLMPIPIIGRFIRRILRRILNLLAIMDRDVGSFFLTTENCIRESANQLLDDNGLHIGGNTYKRLVLTPLMMDFGSKTIKMIDSERKGRKESQWIHYWKLTGKPIVMQVIDVFNGIKKYKEATSSSELCERYESLQLNTNRILEIYPFLGIDTKNYDMNRIKIMMDKYFGKYKGSRNDFSQNMGQFNGDIETITSNFCAGIKVYPPLGFDPWPSDREELEKVSYLYSYCSERGIPITSHGSVGGFVTVSNAELKNNTNLSKWEEVLSSFPELKLNLAHLPMREKILMIFPNLKHPRLKAMLKIVIKNKNVYVDFSNRGVSDKYYKSLRKVLDNLPRNSQDKLRGRVLFGSDFTVNLMGIESYNKYLDTFSKTSHLTQEEKHSFCCVNPERFLFSETG